MTRMTSISIFLGLLLIAQAPVLGQKESRKEAQAAYKVTLGRSLFRSDLLSGRPGTSCATCHEPEQAFADGSAESPGVLGLGIGRNSPALYTVARVEHFPGPDLLAREPFDRPHAMSLAERCLVPIENPLEMASSVKDALKRINEAEGLKPSFELAYGKLIGGVKREHLGEALAAYLGSLAPPAVPYRDYLAGKKDALSPIEMRGLRVFTGRGQCSSCHSGEALSDGLVHPVFPPDSERALKQGERSRELAQEVRRMLRNFDLQLPQSGIGRQFLERLSPPAPQGCDAMGRPIQRSGGYEGGGPPPFPQFQTLSLWDVKNTAPYFRDGSEQDLSQALARHVEELQGVWSQAGQIKKLHKDAIRASRGRARPPLAPEWLSRRDGKPKTPTELSPGDLRAIEAFLGALSRRN